jgi:hypothetical protein
LFVFRHLEKKITEIKGNNAKQWTKTNHLLVPESPIRAQRHGGVTGRLCAGSMDGTSTGDSACTSREHQMTDHMDGTEHQKAKKTEPKRSAKLAIIGGTDTQTQTPQAAVSKAKGR